MIEDFWLSQSPPFLNIPQQLWRSPDKNGIYFLSLLGKESALSLIHKSFRALHVKRRLRALISHSHSSTLGLVVPRGHASSNISQAVLSSHRYVISWALRNGSSHFIVDHPFRLDKDRISLGTDLLCSHFSGFDRFLTSSICRNGSRALDVPGRRKKRKKNYFKFF